MLQQQANIHWCQHFVIVSPNWWWNLPALLKGFIDRVFVPDFAMNYKESYPYVIPLLTGRSAHVIYTQNAPWGLGKVARGDNFWRSINHPILRHCGFKPTRRTVFGPINTSSDQQRLKWLERCQQLGKFGCPSQLS